MLKITDVIIDPRTLGNKLWLVDIQPAYSYVDGHRTDTITGYRYTVALPEKNLEKIAVRIDGEQKMEAPNGFVEVTFCDLDIYTGHRISHRSEPGQQIYILQTRKIRNNYRLCAWPSGGLILLTAPKSQHKASITLMLCVCSM